MPRLRLALSPRKAGRVAGRSRCSTRTGCEIDCRHSHFRSDNHAIDVSGTQMGGPDELIEPFLMSRGSEKSGARPPARGPFPPSTFSNRATAPSPFLRWSGVGKDAGHPGQGQRHPLFGKKAIRYPEGVSTAAKGGAAASTGRSPCPCRSRCEAGAGLNGLRADSPASSYDEAR